MPRIIEAIDVGRSELEIPFRLIVAGGSGSGKTEFVKQIVNKRFYTKPIENIIYCYPDYLADIPTEFDAQVQYHPGLPDTKFMASIPDGSLIILDDLMTECAKCEAISKLFSVVARKRKISVILITQNIYQQGRHFRSIRLNCTGVVLFKFRAAYDSNLRLIRDFGLTNQIDRPILEEALESKHSYIFIDIHPNRQFDFGCIRGNIFNKEITCFWNKMEYVAIPKADFIKYFKIIKEKNGKITAIKNEIEIKKDNSRKSTKRKRKREPAHESESSEEEQPRKRKPSAPTITKRETTTDQSDTGSSTSEPESE